MSRLEDMTQATAAGSISVPPSELFPDIRRGPGKDSAKHAIILNVQVSPAGTGE